MCLSSREEQTHTGDGCIHAGVCVCVGGGEHVAWLTHNQLSSLLLQRVFKLLPELSSEAALT